MDSSLLSQKSISKDSFNKLSLSQHEDRWSRASPDLSGNDYRNRKDLAVVNDEILLSGSIRADRHGLIYPLYDLKGGVRGYLAFQTINTIIVKGQLKSDKRFNSGGFNGGVPCSFFGEKDPVNAKKIIIVEALFKAAAIYQALTDNQAKNNVMVINATSAGGMVKAAKYIISIGCKDKIIIGCDNDADKSPNTQINKQVLSFLTEFRLAYILPPKGDFNDWLALGDKASGEITDAINSPSYMGSVVAKINERLELVSRHKNTATPFEYITGYEGYNNKVNYLIKGYLPVNSMGMVYGGSGEFKSFLVTSWACHIATGTDWNGSKVNQTGVLYIVGEGGAGVPRRVKAWTDKYYKGQPMTNFFRIDRPVHAADRSQSLSLIDTVLQIKADTGIEIGLIVFDTLARCFLGDENSAGQIGSFIGGVDEIKTETNATVIVVHHSGKDATKNARGSSAITAACDFEFKVQRPNKDNSSRELVLSHTKMKDDETVCSQAFTLTSHIIACDEEGDEITSLVVDDQGYEPPDKNELPRDTFNDNQSIIMDAIKASVNAHFEASRAEVRKIAISKGLQPNNFDRSIKQLRARGCIQFEDKSPSILLTP